MKHTLYGMSLQCLLHNIVLWDSEYNGVDLEEINITNGAFNVLVNGWAMSTIKREIKLLQ